MGSEMCIRGGCEGALSDVIVEVVVGECASSRRVGWFWVVACDRKARKGAEILSLIPLLTVQTFEPLEPQSLLNFALPLPRRPSTRHGSGRARPYVFHAARCAR